MQEIDIRTGKVLFQWNSEDHVPYSESEQPLPASASSPWDWFHINAVKVNTDGTFLVDSRDTWTTFDVSPKNGKIIWQLGGKDSSFTLKTANGQTPDNAGEPSPGSMTSRAMATASTLFSTTTRRAPRTPAPT